MKAQVTPSRFSLPSRGQLLSPVLALLALASLVALPTVIQAQTGPEVQDVRPYAPLTGTSIESISLMNGSLNVNIPLWSFPQRGKLKLDFRLGYDTMTFVESQQCVFGGVGGGFPGGNAELRPLSERAHISKATEKYALQLAATYISSQGPSPDAQAPSWSCSDPTKCLGGDICTLMWTPGGYDEEADLYEPETHDGIRVYASTDVAVFPEIGVGHHTDWNKTEFFSGIYWKVRTSDGGSHNLAQTSSGDFRAADGTGWEYQPNTCTLRDNEGTVYSFGCRPPLYPGQFTARGLEALYAPGFLNYMEDTNGNRITVNRTAGGEIVSWTDTMGRTIPALPTLPTTDWWPAPGVTPPPPASGCPAGSITSYSWQIPGVSSPIIFCEASVPVQTHLFPPSDYGPLPPWTHYIDFSASIPMIAGVIQPSGDRWQFQYTPIMQGTLRGTPYNYSYGDLSQITLPTGGTIQYTWGTTLAFCGVKPDGTVSRDYVRSRTLSAGNGAPSSTWLYGGYDASIVSEYGVTEVDPFENITIHTIAPVAGCAAYEAETEYYDNQQRLLKTETTTYQDLGQVPFVYYAPLPTDGALPISKSTTWPDGTTNTTTFSYDSGFVTNQTWNNANVNIPYGNQILKNEYGFSSSAGTLGPLLRSTATTYMAFGSFPESAAAYQQNMIALPSTVTETDAMTGKVHATEYLYDESSLTDGNASAGWDSALTNGPVRGNQTSVSRSLDTTGGNLVTTVGYTNTGMISSITLPANAPYPDTTTTYGYSAAYQGALLTSVTNSLGQSKQYTYDPVTALLQTATDENSNTTTYSYYPDTRLQSIVYPPTPVGRPETDYAYPSATEVDKSQKQSATSSIQQQTFYDGLGRSSETKLLNGCAGGDFIETDTGYDLLGRVSSVSNPHCGASSSSTDGITYHQYDAIGRPTIVTEPDSNTQSWAYNDDTTTFTDENNSSWSRTSDALGRLQTVVEPGGLQTVYGYDGFDNLTSVTQSGLSGTVPMGFVSAEAPKIRSFTYDSLNRLLTSTNPETGTVCYGTMSGGSDSDGSGASPSIIFHPVGPTRGPSSCTPGYDGHGNLLAKTDANGVTQSFTYDALNRLTSKTSSDGSLSSVFYYDTATPLWGGTPFACTNGIGRLCKSDHPGYSGTAYNYDAMGRTVSTLYASDGNGAGYAPGVAAVYDLAGNPTSITYPDGNQVTQTWDAGGRLSSVSSGSVNYISGLSYTPAGAASGFTLGNGVTQTNFYNNRLQPCHTVANALPVASTPSAVLLDRSSFYSMSGTNCGNEPNNNGNIWSIVDNLNVGWTQSFSYDGLNRLTSAFRSDGGYNHSYNYDSFGNLAVQDNINSSPVWDVDPATNQLLSNPIAGVTDQYGHPLNDFMYDLAGNMVSSGTYPIGHTYAYNALNQIISVDNGNTATYDYNGDDERAVKHTPNAWTEYIYFGGQPMAELGSDGSWNDYIYANGQKIAKIATPPGAAATTTYYLDDHLGTAQMELDAGGNVLWTGQFTPFGLELPDGSTNMHYKFTGKERDAESGLDYFGARYYASSIGRWNSPDWAAKPETVPYSKLDDPQSLNLYGYVGNNPLYRFDDDGHQQFTIQLRAYIPQASVLGFKGDNRGPTSSQNVTSRTSITLTIETDPSISQNPLVGVPVSTAGQTEFLPTGSTATQTNGLPTAAVTRDADGNVVVNIQQNAANPITGVAPIRSDLNVTVPASGSSVTTAGTVSGSPAFELNVTGGGATTNVPLQGASNNPAAFAAGLEQTKPILNSTPLPPPPPPRKPNGLEQDAY